MCICLCVATSLLYVSVQFVLALSGQFYVETRKFNLKRTVLYLGDLVNCDVMSWYKLCGCNLLLLNGAAREYD